MFGNNKYLVCIFFAMVILVGHVYNRSRRLLPPQKFTGYDATLRNKNIVWPDVTAKSRYPLKKGSSGLSVHKPGRRNTFNHISLKLKGPLARNILGARYCVRFIFCVNVCILFEIFDMQSVFVFLRAIILHEDGLPRRRLLAMTH